MIKPNLFVVGAPKCGTTSLCHYLDCHPEIVVSNPKEPNVFCRDITGTYGGLWTVEEYMTACFPKNLDNYSYAVDGSVSSLYSDKAVPDILAFNEQAKFIVMLRSPIELVCSLHSHLLFTEQETIKSFSEAWAKQGERKLGQQIPATCEMPKMLQYGAVGLLGGQVERMLQHVKRENIKFILFEDFAEDPRSVYSDVLSFLGVSQDIGISFPVINPSRKRRSRLLQRLIGILAVLRQRAGIKKSFGVLSYLSELNATQFKRPPISVATRQTLTSFFREDVIKLSYILDRDLSHWLKK